MSSWMIIQFKIYILASYIQLQQQGVPKAEVYGLNITAIKVIIISQIKSVIGTAGRNNTFSFKKNT